MKISITIITGTSTDLIFYWKVSSRRGFTLSVRVLKLMICSVTLIGLSKQLMAMIILDLIFLYSVENDIALDYRSFSGI